MLKFIIILIVAWFVGIFGWAQIVGGLQNVDTNKGLIVTIIIWVAIMGAGAYFAIAKLDGTWPLVIGYVASYVKIRGQGKIE